MKHLTTLSKYPVLAAESAGDIGSIIKGVGGAIGSIIVSTAIAGAVKEISDQIQGMTE